MVKNYYIIYVRAAMKDGKANKYDIIWSAHRNTQS